LGQSPVFRFEIGFAGLQVRQDCTGIGEGHACADTGLFGDCVDGVEDEFPVGVIDQR
jgi:hypothetical protein